MSDTDTIKMQQELAFEHMLRGQLDEVVKLANRAVAQLANEGDGKKTQLEKSQFSNLLRVATEPPGSVAIVVNFIRYQMGRSGSGWQSDKDSFGHHIIKDITEELAKLAKNCVVHLPKQDEHDISAQARAHRRLMQWYIGYLSRAFVYGKAVGDFAKLKELSGEQ